MNQEKYIGMDVHQATISVAVVYAQGKLIMECLLETKAATIVEFVRGLHGTLALTFEEGTSATWLHDLLKPHVSRLVVCDPRKNALLKDGNKNDRVDARKLAELLRTNQVKPVYHGKHGTRALRELGELFDHHQGWDSGDESNQIGVPKLGHSPCRYERLQSPSPRRVAGQAGGTRGNGFEPSIYISNWTACNRCDWKHAASCCWKAVSEHPMGRVSSLREVLCRADNRSSK